MDDGGRPRAAGRLLAARHRQAAEPVPERSLLNYAEAPRSDDWTLRSALVRLAQPEPGRVAAVLELVRRLDAVLQPLVRPLEATAAHCDRALTMDAVVGESGGWTLADPVVPYVDARVTDLARIGRSAPATFDAVVDAYAEASPLEREEQLALPLLLVAVELDALADVVAGWAVLAPAEPPNAAVDDTCGRVLARLDALGVPVEQGPPPSRRGRGG